MRTAAIIEMAGRRWWLASEAAQSGPYIFDIVTKKFEFDLYHLCYK